MHLVGNGRELQFRTHTFMQKPQTCPDSRIKTRDFLWGEKKEGNITRVVYENFLLVLTSLS